ncbi:hypothetical protein C0V70_04215 [Bacteriovorax stolpii]|uniref:Phospholipase D-like domain-containing protein n=1 Tax=Bacteriovorax stolpii TaxID=960 RepID=A0A2K9NP95_BACTC|nr:phospholipase D family protein [Bacteriovorax stolpii]AUN97327.1 hypothetical protein C0V70_04215 [Bacteriovorax stolpii]TDP52499.1 phospholipase D-like protein [Bacteriovorax stolpii]
MKIFANEINNNYFRNLVNMVPKASKLEVAVAYITEETLFAEALKYNIPVSIWTLMNDETSIRTLEILKKYSQYPKFKISVFRDHFHAKAIWFHGVGCYFGSANLSDSALNKNIELGVFVNQLDAAQETNLQDLKAFFYSLKDYSAIVDFKTISNLHSKIKKLNWSASLGEIRKEKKEDLNELIKYLDEIFKNVKEPSRNQTKDSLSKHHFITEWKSTIQLLNETASDYKQFGKKPIWIPIKTHINIEIDRMLSWYYDNHIKDRKQGNVYSIIQELHDDNVGKGKENMELVFKLWSDLKEEPEFGLADFFERESFIIADHLSPSRILNLNDEELATVVYHCHALSGYIDKFNSYEDLGIERKKGTRVSLKDKSLAYVKSTLSGTNDEGLSIKDVLNYFIWGDGLLEQRLWDCLGGDTKYTFSGIGRSSLGELIGRARPSEFPVRNERISRTLYALGFDVDYQ